MEGEWLQEILKQLITVDFVLLDQDIYIFLTLN